MYTYTATGSRIRKEVIQGSTTTDYLYSGGFVYKDSTLEYVTHQEGRMVEDAQGDFIYQYNISDHLGNVRVSFEATSGDSLTLLQENHYYPFGLVYMGEGQTQIGSVNQYKYQTKELQDEFSLHWYDFGARMYDAQIGRWHVADAASQFYSPYLAMANNPIRMVDPTGLWADFIRTPGSRHYGQEGYAVHQKRKQGSYWNLYSGKFVVNPQDENYKWFAWVFDESNSFKDIADVNNEFGGGSGGSDFRFRILKYKENACADEFAKNEEKRHKYMQLVEEDPAAAEAFLDEIMREIRGAQTGLMASVSEDGDGEKNKKESSSNLKIKSKYADKDRNKTRKGSALGTVWAIALAEPTPGGEVGATLFTIYIGVIWLIHGTNDGPPSLPELSYDRPNNYIPEPPNHNGNRNYFPPGGPGSSVIKWSITVGGAAALGRKLYESTQPQPFSPTQDNTYLPNPYPLPFLTPIPKNN